MKVCFKCKEKKPFTEFWKDKKMVGGYFSYCIPCGKETGRVWKKANPDKLKASDKAYKTKHKEKHAKKQRGYAKRNPNKVRAQRLLYKAVKRGDLIRPSECSRCKGNKEGYKIEGHHFDYSKPLEVVWLCHNCHVDEHR